MYGLGGGLLLRPSIVRGACMGLTAVCFYGTPSFGGRVWAWRRFASTAFHRSGGVYGLGCGLRPPRSLLNRLVRTRTAAPARDKSPSGPTVAFSGGCGTEARETRTNSGRRRPLQGDVGREQPPHGGGLVTLTARPPWLQAAGGAPAIVASGLLRLAGARFRPPRPYTFLCAATPDSAVAALGARV